MTIFNTKRSIFLVAFLMGIVSFVLCGFTLRDNSAEDGNRETADAALTETADSKDMETEFRPFSFLWITDTQAIAYLDGMYEKLGNVCTEYIENNNVVYFFGTGDYVGRSYFSEHWAGFQKMYKRISVPKIMVAGNHDISAERKSEKEQAIDIFLEQIYGERLTSERYYKNGLGVYDLFSAGGSDWIVIGMHFEYGEEELNWMDRVLKQYPDRKAVLLLHDYANGDRTLMPQGSRLYKKVVVPNENVRLILCGHCHGKYAWKQRPNKESDRFVVTIMYNFQDSKRYKGAPILLTIDPKEQKLHLDAYPFIGGVGHIQYDTDIDLNE